jgi:aryl-alcohol dehydrogenase-like predicted oxidoreductase
MTPERSVHWLGDELQGKVAALLDYAESIDVPILSLAFSWLLSHGAVSSVIAGASNAEQIQANAKAVRTLSPDVVARLNELTS